MCKKGHMGVRQFGPRIFLKGFDAFMDALTTSTDSYSAIEKHESWTRVGDGGYNISSGEPIGVAT